MKRETSNDSLKERTIGFLKALPSSVAASIIASFLIFVAGWLFGRYYPPRYQSGDTIQLGSYEQDNDETNGPEKIDWYVISKEDGAYLLLSKYVLDARPYNTERGPVSWEKSSVRAWLNDEFLAQAFSDREKKKILMTNNINPDNDETSTKGGNATRDMIFLLSADEAKQFLTSDTAFGISTDYAFWQGARTYEPYASEDKKAEYIEKYSITSKSGQKTELPLGITKECFWTLRTPGKSQEMVARVYNSFYSDTFSGIGVFVDHDGVMVDGNMGIRPAIWYKP